MPRLTFRSASQLSQQALLAVLASGEDPDGSPFEGTLGYAADVVAGTVDIPAAARLKKIMVIAGVSVGATVTIGGGATVTIPAGFSWEEDLRGSAVNADVVIGGTVQAYYVSWVA